MNLILAHLFGDYVLQSDWMATNKVRHFWIALIHGIAYTIPFAFISRDWRFLAFVCLTHALIDRFRLAKYVCWAKNFLAPRWLDVGDEKRRNHPWSDCQATGYGPDKPPWMAVWLLILTDNTLHLACNLLASKLWVD